MLPTRMRAVVCGLLLAGVAAPQVVCAGSFGPGYVQTNLVADTSGVALAVDLHLVNPWGVAFFPGGAFWISDNATGLSTLYDGLGHVIPVVFSVPGAAGQTAPATPTGIVINTSQGFHVPGTSIPAAVIFATEDGTISAWAGGLPTNPLAAVLAADNSAIGAVYKGLEFGTTAAGNFIYATNFHAGTIDVFDTGFAPAGAKLLGSFSDPEIQQGYAPFGIRNVNGNLYVTYARQDGGSMMMRRGRGMAMWTYLVPMACCCGVSPPVAY